jgi:predicted metal-dependent peptidase
MADVMPENLAAARLRLARNRPYLASALWALSPRERKGMMDKYGAAGHIGVDRYFRLYYDPDGIAEWSVDELEGVMYHEVGHLLRAHSDRQPTPNDDSDYLVWNMAGDMEINDDIAAERVALPKGALLPSTFAFKDGELAEEYYYLLQQHREQHRAKCPQCGKQPSMGNGGCGSAAGGPAQEYEDPSEGGHPRNGISRTEAELIRNTVAQDVQQHAKNRGTVPGWMARWANERLAPVVDWRKTLSALIRRSLGDARGMQDYTYSRPSRRQSASPDVIMPAMRQPIVRAAVVVDTSGSMGEKELAMALAEIDGVLQACGQHGCDVLSCDAAVHTARRVFSRQAVALAGGGGTDMRVGIEAALARKPRPDVVIVVSDGYTPWPAEAPAVPVIACLTAKSTEPPGWIKTVYINGDGS